MMGEKNIIFPEKLTVAQKKKRKKKVEGDIKKKDDVSE